MTSGWVSEEDLFPFLAVVADMVEYDFGPDTDWLAIYHAIYSDPNAGDEHWVAYRFEGKRAADFEFAWEPGSGVISYRLSTDPNVEFASDWVAHTLTRWKVTEGGRPLGRDGKPRPPYVH
jgi:hypothetical protein